MQEIRCRADGLRREVVADIQRQQPDAEDARQYLHPRYAAEFLRIEYEEHPELDMSLGLVGGATRRRTIIAGLFDRREGLIVVSEKFPEEERRFTGLHEVGHAVLHPELCDAHRDRPIDLRDSKSARGLLEWQADRFAVEYAMPARWVVRDTVERFGKVPIEIDETLLWNLDPNDPDRFWRRSSDDLDLEKAVVNYAGFGQFPSLKTIYGVSLTAMAVRAKELKLIEGARSR